MEKTQYLGGIKLLRLKANGNIGKIAKFTDETTFEVLSPEVWQFRVETTIKIKVGTSIEVYSIKGWKCKVGTSE